MEETSVETEKEELEGIDDGIWDRLDSVAWALTLGYLVVSIISGLLYLLIGSQSVLPDEILFALFLPVWLVTGLFLSWSFYPCIEQKRLEGR